MDYLPSDLYQNFILWSRNNGCKKAERAPNSFSFFGCINREICLLRKLWTTKYIEMVASEPKWVNPILNIIGVNLLRLGGLQIE